MTDAEIFDLADKYGWLDDFGRMNFNDDGLINFALALRKAEWVGLEEEEVMGLTCECVDDGTFNMDCAYDFARAIEVKLKEKNDGLR